MDAGFIEVLVLLEQAHGVNVKRTFISLQPRPASVEQSCGTDDIVIELVQNVSSSLWYHFEGTD
jgi:hypothetical protein